MTIVERLHALRKDHRAGINDCQREYVAEMTEQLQLECQLETEVIENVRDLARAVERLSAIWLKTPIGTELVNREAPDLGKCLVGLQLLVSVLPAQNLQAAE